MIKILRFSLFILFFYIVNTLQSQSIEYSRLVADYPISVKTFPPEKQNATYVFAIDVSSSLEGFADLLRQNLHYFVNALPDGDRLTIIQEREPGQTGFIYLPNTLISGTSKVTFNNYLQTISFNNVNESDGFGMTQKIIDAIDQTGGTDLVYIFIFTDFEYYTRQNGYEINRCDWRSLEKRYEGIQMGRRIVKVGLQVPYTGHHPEAIFREKLNSIFNGVTYYPVIDQGSLENWFADIRANILRDRLRFIIEKAIIPTITPTAPQRMACLAVLIFSGSPLPVKNNMPAKTKQITATPPKKNPTAISIEYINGCISLTVGAPAPVTYGTNCAKLINGKAKNPDKVRNNAFLFILFLFNYLKLPNEYIFWHFVI